ncbi:hypothetical protein ABZ502_02215 [Streptomyces abikoensis]|uniref:hypothetical protein n=1 Tax=Streptomyces abikoensis TaxID=97398 RepID=UPI0033E0749E
MSTHASSPGHGKRGGHGWMMIACCVPMLVAAIMLVATGLLSPEFLITAVMCMGMMALMMRGMGRDNRS